ncbi:MAG: hypothetical protein HQM09_14465 [Candidatus Riflebacteria bacterium]|nr:hypothetical protein [Candidatus Riflebacteria bacterium]
MRILILEDDPSRRKLFQVMLEAEGFEFNICADPMEFLRELVFPASRIWLISLDHDLSEIKRSCGVISLDCGCAVVEFMRRMRPVCPVILHSQNESARAHMAESLKQADWTVSTITDSHDLDGSWIKNSWLELIKSVRETLMSPGDITEIIPDPDEIAQDTEMLKQYDS